MADDTFTFLVTTDNHLGFMKSDSIRCKDAFMAFAESLEIARRRNADFVLLGGDLFHENRPSTNIEHKCIKIIRKHMTDQKNKPTTFCRIAGNFSHFHKLNHANFEDPNMKVACPLMTIHGNHDDPTGPDAQSICEKLATCGLLNYFGAMDSTKKNIVIEPIVLQKGQIKIALYGMGFMPDYKLKILFDKGQVIFMEPPPDTFNVLVVHQNRIPLHADKFISDETFPTFFHLIIRGHEHNAQSPEIIPESEVNGMVYQPGSTVATSITVLEAAPKKVCLISIRIADPRGDNTSRFKMLYELIDLKCCRSMLLKDITQKDIFKNVRIAAGSVKVTSSDFKRLSKEFVIQTIENLLKNYEADRSSLQDSQISAKDGSSSQPEKLSRFALPLVRIRLEYVSKNERFDDREVADLFWRTRVANRNIILFKKQKQAKAADGTAEYITFANDLEDVDEDLDDFDHVDLDEWKRDTIEYKIEQWFMNKPQDERLKALSLAEYTKAVQGCGEDGNAITKVLGKRKMEVSNRYRAALTESDVESKFHNQDFVDNWYLRAFINTSCNMGGDESVDMEVIEIK